VIAYAAGAPFDPLVGLALAAMVAGIVLLASHQPHGAPIVPGLMERPAVVGTSAVCAVAFGAVFYFAGAAVGVSALWLLALSRLVGLLLVVVIMRPRRLTLPRDALPWIFITGFAYAAGFLTYVQGAQANLEVTAVVTSQYAGLAVLASVLLLREELLRRDRAAIVVLLASAACVALLGN
jgi:hypothetical protein